MHLYLIRHAQSHVNIEGWQGSFDAGLTDLGHQQAQILTAWLPKVIPEFDILYASTLTRAQETAAYISQAYHNQPIHSDDRLREMGNNRFDHSPWPADQLPTEYSDYWSTSRPYAPCANKAETESWMHFRIRVGTFIEETVERNRDKVVVVICHGGVIDAVFDHIFNLGPWRQCEIWTSNTGLTHFEYVDHPGRETWRLRCQNWIPN